MKLLLLATLPVLALATLVIDTLSIKVEPKQVINGTVEYETACKTCPYNLCTNVVVPSNDDIVTLTCWTEGDLIDDTDLWVKTTDDCFITEYDLVEYEGDFSEDLDYCGRVDLDITRQDAEVRYLSECKWEPSTAAESILYYGRDLDVTLTCWTEGYSNPLDTIYWYKTTDNCHVSGSGLWAEPDRDGLDNCGPGSGPRINETKRAFKDEAHDTQALCREDEALTKRYLVAEQIGEEYAPCYTCPSANGGPSCRRKKRYEYNDTVVSQCLTYGETTYPNGTIESILWLLTTDWCYVDGDDFWVPPWDNYRFPLCSYWEGYE